MKTRVFIASTVYDLIDARAEVEQFLRELGLDPLLSDSVTSDFQVCPDRNSIEACLVNVRASDYVIVLLSKRYGPSLQKAGFQDVSATHLEYHEARNVGKPILFYVRDRLESDFSTWRKNKPDLSLSWVDDPKNYRLFEFIEEHHKLSAEEKRSNWYQTFRTSVDLKNLIARDLKRPAAKASLEKAIQENQVPIFHADVDLVFNTPSPGHCMAKFMFTNMGTVPAYNVQIVWGDDKPNPANADPVIAPGRGLFQGIAFPLPEFKQTAMLEYHTPQGHKVVDGFFAWVRSEGGTTSTLVKLVTKKYMVGKEPPFEIVE